MPIDVFLHLEGVEGESRDDKHKGEIDVLAWSWGMSNAGSAAFHRGGGGGAGKVSFQDLNLTKFVDKSSTGLMHACATGGLIPQGKLTVRTSGEKPVEYLKVTFGDVLITSVSVNALGLEDDRLTETVTLNYRLFEYVYTPQREDGSEEPPKTFFWDLAKNKGA